MSAQRVGRNKVYRPAVKKTEVIGDAVDDFLEHMFDGQLLPMVRHLVGSRDVTPEEINDLMRIVENLRKEVGDD